MDKQNNKNELDKIISLDKTENNENISEFWEYYRSLDGKINENDK